MRKPAASGQDAERPYLRAPAGLDPAAIVREALATIDEQGPDKLSMRALSQRLGVSAPAIYWHFPDREAVLDGVAAFILGSRAEEAPPGDWRERVGARLRAIRRQLLHHPKAFPLFTKPDRLSRATLTVIEDIAVELSDAGIADAELVRALQKLFIHTLGSVFVQTTVMSALSLPARNPAAARKAIDAFLSEHASRDSVIGAAMRDHADAVRFSDMFDETVNLFLADIAERAASRK